MKYTEFEEKVKEIDGIKEVDHKHHTLYIRNSAGDAVMHISKAHMYSMYTTYGAWKRTSDVVKAKLYQLAYELTATPLEEREEPKKYYYRLPYIARGTNYLNIDTVEGLYYSTNKQVPGIKTQFTREEYAAIAKEHGIPQGVHKEEEV